VICLYLLRGYCSFWTEESTIGRELNWAKASLNDFIQAYYLCWRLYNQNYGNCSPDDIFKFDNLWKNLEDESCIFNYCLEDLNDKERLGFIIWWLFLFIDIFSGNVYRKIYNDEAAFDHYCRAIRRFDSKD